MITRREKIALYLKEYTEKAIDKNGIDLQGITASDITDHFKMDRTTSSRELNALYNDGTAMKFLGRPTHYLHYQTVLSAPAACVSPPWSPGCFPPPHGGSGNRKAPCICPGPS